MIEIRNLRDLRYHLKRKVYSNKDLINIIESCLMVWVVNDYTNEQLIKIVEDLTSKYACIPDRPLFI